MSFLSAALIASLSLVSQPEKIVVLPCQLDEKATAEIPVLVNDYVPAAVADQGYETLGADDIEALIGFVKQKDLFGCDDASCFASGAPWARAHSHPPGIRPCQVDVRCEIVACGG